MPTRITKSFSFDAAHWLPHVPPGHKCGRLHGHTYTVSLILEGALDPQLGWVMDFSEVKSECQSLLTHLDHVCLNEVPGLENPTAEILARWIFQKLKPQLPRLVEVTVHETPTSSASYRL